jgi:ABC-type transport system involved in multi-copper enzyme maturation permease subunit
MVVMALLAVTLVFSIAEAPGSSDPSAPGQRPGAAFTTTALEEPEGMVLGFSLAAQLLGVVSLVLFVQTTGGEYGFGTLKALLSREPRRLVLLAGKLLAMALFVGMAILAALVLQTVEAWVLAQVRGIETSGWLTPEGARGAAGILIRTWIAALAWGLMGAMLGILFRSGAPAIGVGIGYTLVGETLLVLAWRDGQSWLPGQVLSAFVAGGNQAVSMGRAGLVLAAYMVLFALIAGLVFHRRDVSS